MNLPSLTFTEAANLYKSIAESDGDVLALVPPNEVLVTLASALVVFGRQLERDQQVILEQKDSIEELNAHLRAYLDDHLAGRLESDLSDEALVTEAELREQQDLLRDDGLAGLGVIHAIEWRGPGRVYFDHFPEINKELANGIAEMARQRLDDSIEGVSDVIETTETNVETPGQAPKPEL